MGFVPIAVGAELITMFAIANKASGIYGLLSIVTGHPITAPQLLMNVLSVILLISFLFALHSIRKQNALPVVAYSYIYFFDMLANVAFTIYFSVTWFRHFDEKTSEDGNNNGGDSLNVASERGLSITVIVLALVAKIYFCFVLFGFARLLVRKSDLRPDNGTGKYSRALQFILLSIASSFWRMGGRRAGKGRMVNTLETDSEVY
ncbi:Inositolphosphorylceramide synthase subunit Kei1-domain-containing protein [Dipodascopsis uninucleata]